MDGREKIFNQKFVRRMRYDADQYSYWAELLVLAIIHERILKLLLLVMNYYYFRKTENYFQ